ncbi:MAG: LysR family transcriptional regulator [Clostridia bacterium]|nr:LysR family transcriptional regulator [Clostridia bacterium]
MTLQQLKYFCVVAQLLSVRKASEELHISQSTISISIANLETELGLPLFKRENRSVALTKYGSLYYEKIMPLLDSLSEINVKMKRLASETEGDVNIGYNPPWCYGFVPRLAREFLRRKENEKIIFSFKQMNSPRIIEGLKDGRFDVGFCTTEREVPDIFFFPLFRQEMAVIVPSGHPLAARGSVNLRDISPYPYILYEGDSGLCRLVKQMLKNADVEPKIAYEAPNEEAIFSLVSSGFGIALVAITDALKKLDVRALKVENFDAFCTLYMAYNTARYLPPAAIRFANYIKQCARQGILNEFRL